MTDTRQVDEADARDMDMERDGAEWTLVHSADCIPAAETIPSDAASTAHDAVVEGAPGNVEAASLEELSQADAAASLRGPGGPSEQQQHLQQHLQQQEQQEQEQLEAILADSAAATGTAVATATGADADPAAAESPQDEEAYAAEPAQDEEASAAEPAQGEEASAAAAPTTGTITYVAATSPWLSWMACLLGTACPPTCAPDSTHADQAQTELGSWLTSAGDMVGSMVEEVREEWTELAALVSQAVNTGQGVAAQQVKAFRVRMGKAMHGNTWVLLSLGAVTAVACIAMGTLVLANHRLAHQLKQRDKELARLLLRTMRLQETLQSSCAAVPVLRLTSLQPAFAVSSLG